MPHFFPSLRRSKDRDRDTYARYDAYDHYDSRESQPSAWRRVVPTRHRDDGKWQEEFVEYPESYAGTEEYHGRRRSDRPTERDYVRRPSYDVQSETTATATEDFGDSRYYSRDNAVPIVQRESSLTRLQEAFSDHASSSRPRPVTEVSLPPQGTPRHNPVEVPPPPPVAPEIRNVYPAQQQPILVQNSTADSVEADIRIQRSQSRVSREKRAPSRHRTEMRREPSLGGRPMDDEEYPPCVVVVERGHDGKPDTYYVIPGGAPVIFEDERGNELTRVGDFSGRYRPRKQRPVIIEDEHGREVGRVGFDDESSIDYPHHDRSDDGTYGRERGYGYHDQYRSTRHDYDRASSRSSPSSSSFHYSPQERDHYERDRYRTTDMEPRGITKPFPNLVYIPYNTDQRSQGSSHRSSRSSTHNYTPSGRSYQSSSVIHLDDYKREGSRSVSSGSSGRRSYGSSHRR